MRRIQHGTIDSTNERALAALAAGEAQHLDLHVAAAQSAGRGRRGRAWVSEPGGGLYLSLVWCAPRLASGAALTVAAGLGTLDGVRAVGLGRAGLKWPNDVVLGEAKLAGVLVETRGLDLKRPVYVVGVGVNVGQREFPPELLEERAVTSLGLQGLDVSLEQVERALVPALIARLEAMTGDPARLARDFVAAAGFEGRVRASTGEEQLLGRVLDLDLERGLTLALDGGGQRCLPLERLRGLVPAGPDPA